MPILKYFLSDLTRTEKIALIALGPLETFLLALLPVLGYVFIRYRRSPTRPMLFVVFIGSQFPDLVDKPLELARVVPWGRVGMHSLPFAIPAAVLVLVYARATDRTHLGVGFVFAYSVHWLTDWIPKFIEGTIPPSIFWPFTTISKSPGAWWGGPGQIFLILWSICSVILLGLVLVLLVRDISNHLN